MALGVTLVSSGLLTVLVILLQSAMTVVAESSNALLPSEHDEFHQYMQKMHRIWWIFAPLMIVSGGIYFFAGKSLTNGSQRSRRVALANTLFGYLFLIAYQLTVLIVIGWPPVISEAELPNEYRVASYGILAVATLFLFAIPTGMTFVLTRPVSTPPSKPDEPRATESQKAAVSRDHLSTINEVNPLKVDFIGIITFLPWIISGLALLVIWNMFTSLDSGEPPTRSFGVAALLMTVAAVVNFGLLIYLTILLFKLDTVPNHLRAVWIVILFFGAPFTAPLFWYFYLWKPSRAVS